MVLGLFSKRKDILPVVSLGLAITGAIVTIWCAVLAWQQPPEHPLVSSWASLSFSTVKSQPEDQIKDPAENQFEKQTPDLSFHFYADRLAAFFLLLTGVFTLAVSLHLINGLENIPDPYRVTAVFNLFVLAIVFTILSDTVYSFLFFEECMTLAFAYLALFRHNAYLEKENVSAKDLAASKTAFKAYLIFEHVGIMLIAAALLILSVQIAASLEAAPRAGETFTMPSVLSFAQFRQFRNAIPEAVKLANPWVSSLVFLLSLAGFGIKAGVFPAHVWVPMVHPYSPTSIHAMMSGIALKVAGLYGMYRVFFFFLSPIQWWWGWLVLLLAGATAIFGVFYALLGKDLKTALASHSVENVGIILAGIGLALIFSARGNFTFETALYGDGTAKAVPQYYFEQLAGLAIIASLYHLVNHSAFKGLLFFCTGAIENRLGVVALDRLGGLMKRYPLTSAAFLIGSVSIAGFPPFNGFVSEWLLLQTLFAGMDLYYAKERIFLLVGFVLLLLCLVLAFSLTALAFVKIAGEVLLGAPRDPQVAKNARPGEVGLPMRTVLITFSALCLFLGLFPVPVTQQLGQLTADVQMIPGFVFNEKAMGEKNLGISIPMIDRGVIAGSTLKQDNTAESNRGDHQPETYQTRLSNRMLETLFAILFVSILLSLLVGFPFIRRRMIQYAPPWTNGTPFFDRLMQYTGTAFASLISRPFEREPVLKASDAVLIDGSEQKESLPYRELVTSGRYVPELTRLVYNRLLTRLLLISEKTGIKLQPGNIRAYLQYIFLLFIGILIFLLALVERQVAK